MMSVQISTETDKILKLPQIKFCCTFILIFLKKFTAGPQVALFTI